MKKLAMMFLLCGAAACGSSGDDGGSCDKDLNVDNLKATAVTKQSSSDDGCPDITPEFINQDDGSDDSDDCKPVANKAQCEISVDCTDEDGTTIKGSFDVDGDELKGVLTVETTAAQGGLSCSYELVWK